MKRFFTLIPWSLIILLCILVGLAPFTPRPHLIEKIAMLADGQLHKPIDIFDLILHGGPFVLLAGKAYFFQRDKQP